MKYWPVSAVASSGVSRKSEAELRSVYRTRYMSPSTFHECGHAAARLPGVETPMAIIESVGCAMRRVYTTYPGFDDWMALEQGGFVANEDGFFGFMVDALH